MEKNSIADWTSSIIDLSDIGLILLDKKQTIQCWNQWMVQSSGINNSDAIGKTFAEVFPNVKSARLLNAIDDALCHGMASVLSQKLNPHKLPLYKSVSSVSEHNLMAQMIMIKPIISNQTLCLVQVVDVSAAVARDHMLRIQAAEYHAKELHNRAILSSIADAVITTDINGRVEYMNSIAENMTGWNIKRANGYYIEEVFSVHSEDGKDPIPSIGLCIKNENIPNSFGNNLVLVKEDGTAIAIEESLAAIYNSQSEITGSVLVFRDVTRARKLADEVNWQAEHDSLTKLYNSEVFDKKLHILVESTKNIQAQHALLYLDLDQFKIVNDTCGHVAGDELLIQVSKLLSEHIRNCDVLARLGGDEFGIQLFDCPINICMRIANKIRQAIKDYRFVWGEKSFSIGVSIGVVKITDDNISVKDLLSASDAACYAAKDGGRNQVHLYQADVSEAAARHGEMQWFSRIQKALEKNEFLLYAQTIEPLDKSDTKTHLEVLIRMRDEQGELIPPGAFIPAAERFGLMSSIDRWVVENVFKMISASKEYIAKNNFNFAINLSGQTLSDNETLSFITKQLEKHQITKGSISFEITETAAISNLSSANTFIKSLKAVGCKFALDDFGSGLSSFAYLKNLPVDFLKIDGAFVKDMVNDPIDCAMVNSINQIGHVMNLKTIAEFVENDEILEKLKEIGVDYVQGFGICKPYLLADKNGNMIH
ncbi:MAG: EAL domain-containing protein [Colwellia sp.]|nr:EAL domain-containing protein [Colwellia sp.]